MSVPPPRSLAATADELLDSAVPRDMRVGFDALETTPRVNAPVIVLDLATVREGLPAVTDFLERAVSQPNQWVRYSLPYREAALMRQPGTVHLIGSEALMSLLERLAVHTDEAADAATVIDIPGLSDSAVWLHHDGDRPSGTDVVIDHDRLSSLAELSQEWQLLASRRLDRTESAASWDGLV